MNKRLQILILVLLLNTVFVKSYAQVFINEACAYNGTVIEDEDGDKPDWFELYNAGGAAVSLDGYFVVDGSMTEWYFPSRMMAAGSYLLVFASGKDRKGSVLHTSFKLSKEGEKLTLYDPSGLKSDELQCGNLQLDHSMGRYPDGNPVSPGIFSTPTPGNTNNGSILYSAYTENPLFSANSGFYPDTFLLTISTADPFAIIYYTMDGSIPSDTAIISTGAVPISKTVVVRARTFSTDPLILPSEVQTNTYILNYIPSLPVISISTNPANLWDWNTGIYVMGPNADSIYPFLGANFWQDWEVPAHLEFFESDHKQAFEQDLGLSINGGAVSRTRPQRSFRISARSKYGNSVIHHKMFVEKNISSFNNLVLRNSSGDFNKTHFRDGSLHKLMLGHTNIDLLSYRPSVIYLNGEYWGILNIRERFSQYYLEENHGIDPDKVDLLEEDSTIIEGDYIAFDGMYNFVTQNDMSTAANYNKAKSMIDIESLCDYFIAETFLSNIDWPYNNIKYWRLREPGMMWRYLLMDLDISLGNYGWAPASMDVLGRLLGSFGENNKHVRIFKSLLKNQVFRNFFINRYADLVNTLFSSENMGNHIASVKAALEEDIPMHFIRWGNTMEGWNHEIDSTVIPYIKERPTYALTYVRDTFHLAGIVDVSLGVWPPAGGTVKVNTILPAPLPWTGRYFNGVPVTITAIPNSGFTFMEWKTENVKLSENSQNSITVNLDTNAVLIAYFNNSASPREISIYPNPANEALNAGFLSNDETKGTMLISNTLGQMIESIAIDIHPGPNFIRIETTSLRPGSYFLSLKGSASYDVTKVIVIH